MQINSTWAYLLLMLTTPADKYSILKIHIHLNRGQSTVAYDSFTIDSHAVTLCILSNQTKGIHVDLISIEHRSNV